MDDLADFRPRRVLKPFAVHALQRQTLHVHALQQFALDLLLDVAAQFTDGIVPFPGLLLRGRSVLIACGRAFSARRRTARSGIGPFLTRRSLGVGIVADAQHALADLHDHGPVEDHRTVDRLAVDIRAVRAMQVFDDHTVGTDGQNRVTLADVGEVKTDATDLTAPDEPVADRQGLAFTLSVDERRECEHLTVLPGDRRDVPADA